MRHRTLLIPALALLVTMASGAPAGHEASEESGDHPGLEALDYAFRFASAIDPDPKDKAKAQEDVVRELSMIDALFDAALERAASVEGWRRGVVYADLATIAAERGDVELARKLIGRAEAVRSGVKGWQNPRIAAHIAKALAAMGDKDRSREVASHLAEEDPQQYTGRAVATSAVALARQGDFDGAMKNLAALEDEGDVYIAWWRWQGYMDLSRMDSLTVEQRLEALEAAREAAEGVAGWKQAQTLQTAAEELLEFGKKKPARESLKKADAIVEALPDTHPAKTPMLAMQARAWSKLGNSERANTLLEQAEALVPETLVIEQPAIYGYIGGTYWDIGDEKEAWRLFDQALESAKSLVNARPRALAVVAICRTLGRHGVPLNETTRARFDGLFNGLRDPW